METWKGISGTNGIIEVSDKGRVRSWLGGTPRVLKTQTDRKGYHRVSVKIERIKMHYKLHREVAKAFLENPNNLPQVNHKDGDKNNNDASNLEWVTNLQNAHHAIESGLWGAVFEASRESNERRKKPIIAFRTDEEQCVRKFESISEAEREIGSRHICDVLKGKRSHVKGWHFKYAEGVMPNAATDDKPA